MTRLSNAHLALVLVSVVVPTASAQVCTPTVQWIWEGPTRSPSFPEPCITPLVLQLDDDDGDGRITTSDVPDVVFTHFGSGNSAQITVVDGVTGAEKFVFDAPNVLPTALAAGDLDGDGLVEIVALHDDRTHIVAFEHDGTFKWQSDPAPLALYEFEPIAIADLDQDGSPEVFVGAMVFAADGTFLWQGSRGGGLETHWSLIHISHAVDLLPLNPGLELLAGNTVYDATGAVIWHNDTIPDGWTAVADFDLDGDPEIVHTTKEQVRMLDHLGNTLGSPYTVPGTLISQPLAADLDGDGLPEVVVINDVEVQSLSWTGAAFVMNWLQRTNDATRVNGASAFDLDGDGASELLYHDQERWYVMDGRSGAILSVFPFNSATLIETPVIADIDNDCVSEILVSGCQGGVAAPSPNSVIAYECSPSVAARPMWNQFSYHVTNVEDDGTIPQFEAAPWTVGLNGWLEQRPGGGGLSADPGRPLTICVGSATVLDASGSSGCGALGMEFRWLDGATVACDWSTDPTCAVMPAATTTYTVEVACVGSADCIGSAPVVVEVRSCSLEVQFDRFEAAWRSREPPVVEVSWRTTLEQGTLGFVVERATSSSGPFVVIGDTEARGAGADYALRDATAVVDGWYRIVEMTMSGRGDRSVPFQVGHVAIGRARSRADRRSGRPHGARPADE